MANVVFIEDQHHSEQHFTRGFRVGAFRSGWTPAVVWLRDATDRGRPVAEVSAEIEAARPDLIVWIMDAVLTVAECLETEALRGVPKVSLWFDDHLRTLPIQKYPERHRRLCEHGMLQTWIWDGYWRERFTRQFSVPCAPVHLAADEFDCFPGEPTHFRGCEDALIFIGNIPSLEHITRECGMLPAACRELVLNTQQVLAASIYGRMGYDALEEACEALPRKQRMVVDRFREDLFHRILLNRFVWMLAKREVRLRILRLATQQRRLVILSGHTNKTFVGAGEMARDLGATRHPVQFIDTNHVPLHQLGCLYHIGGLHLQATDPQSVEGGIPFRVFETAASGRPLLSDFKTELAGCFIPGREILCFQSDQDFPDALGDTIRRWGELAEIGRAAHARFLREHTWRHRFEDMVARVNAGAD